MTELDLAALILRVSIGGLFLAHAWLKYSVFTPVGSAEYFKSLGVPAFMAYVTMAAETVGGLALIFGIATRPVAALLILLMLGTIALVHGRKGFWFTNEGGGWEYPALWTVCLVVIVLIGSGQLALYPIWG